jgi:3-methylcrotonyl-CoA carboxylase alpha subunit
LQVEQGDILYVMEAMKMEHSIRAPEKGAVTSLSAGVGDLIEGGTVLAVVAPAE